MTREQEIEQAMKDSVAGTIYASGWGMTPRATDLLECAFTKGAKWADEHPDSNHTYTKQQLIDMGFAFTTNGDIVTPKQENEHLKKYLQYQRGKLIDKACEWLKNTIDDDVFVNCGDVIKFMLANEFVEYFRKAIEE